MNKLFANKKILLALRLLMGSVFILASIDKIFNPAVFSSVLREYKLLPEILIPLVSVTLPLDGILCRAAYYFEYILTVRSAYYDTFQYRLYTWHNH